MTAAVVALSVALAGALAAIGYLAWRVTQVSPELVAAGKRELAADQRAEVYRQERDMALLREIEANTQKSAAIVRLKIAEQQRNQAAEEARKHVVESIRSKNLADAVRLVDELLTAPIPGLPETGDTAADGDRQGATAVQPAKAGTIVSPRRGS